MAYVVARGRVVKSRAGAAAMMLGVAAMVVLPSVVLAADINVEIDDAKLVKLPEKASTVVIGNPLIADVTLQPGGLMVITGKGYGMTNLIALDRGGKVLMSSTVDVRSPRNVVVVYRGVARETYSCEPLCERRITLGDAGPYFEQAITQTGTRNGMAAGAAPAAPK